MENLKKTIFESNKQKQHLYYVRAKQKARKPF
jgi:hypothetical protein